MIDYAIYFLMGLFGIMFHAGLKMRSIQEKARLANVEFFPMKYLKDDWLSLSLSLLTVVITLFLVEEFAQFSDAVMKYVKFGFLFTGYTGSDILSRFLSVANKRVNDAIDKKTTLADEINHTTDKPTPTAKQ